MDITKGFISERVTRLRNKAGLTQAELAERAKMSLRGLQDIEYGRSKSPEIETIGRIAGALKMTISEFLGETVSNKKSELFIAIVNSLAAMDEEQLGTVINFIEDISSLSDSDSSSSAI